MSGNFTELLDRAMNEVPEPSLYPTGTWRCRVVNVSQKEDDDGNKVFNIAYEPIEPQDDVDPGELEAVGDGAEGERIWVKRTIKSRSDIANFKRFLLLHGIDDSLSILDGAKELKGREVLGFISVRSYTDNSGELRTVNDLKQFVPVE